MGMLGNGRLDVETEDNQDQVVAFQKVFKEFSLTPANKDNWPIVFNQVFGFSVESFYEVVKNYPKQIDWVLPSNDLTLEIIFNQ